MTDASVCSQTGAGGFGMWVVSERGKMPYGGSFQQLTSDSLIGELRAAVNSLAVSLNHKMIQNNDFVLIQLDNTSVVDLLNGKAAKRPDTIEAMEKFHLLVKAYNLKIKARHVKGHSNKKDNRYVSNNCCDFRAKQGMRQRRAELLAGANTFTKEQ